MGGVFPLSWPANRRNGVRIAGVSGTITGSILDWESVELTSRSGRRKVIPLKGGGGIRSVADLGPTIMNNFLAVVAGEEAPLIPGRDVVPSIALIEECYARRRRLPMPWQDYAS